MSLSIADLSVNEAAGTADLTVTLSAQSGKAVSFNWLTSNATALSGSDYTAVTSTLETIAAGSTTKTLNVTINNDLLDEINETFSVDINTPVNASITTASATVTITDNDAEPSLSFSPTSETVEEGNDLDFTVVLSTVSGRDVLFNYSTVNGTAVSGSDYTAVVNQLVTITAGQTSKTITVGTTDDAVTESTETLTVNLSTPSGATIGAGTATGNITDNEAPDINIAATGSGEEGTTVSVTVTLSQTSAQTVTVDYTTQDNSATVAAGDYTAVSNTLTFTPGQTSKDIDVDLLQDYLSDPGENFKIVISNPGNAFLGSTTESTVSITEDVVASAAPTNFTTVNIWESLSSTPPMSWDAHGEGDLSHYVVEVRNASDDNLIESWRYVGNTTSTQLHDIIQIDQKSFYANIRAVDTAGNQSPSTRIQAGAFNYWVIFEPHTVSSISNSNSHTCAAVNGEAKYWGYNSFGQLGDGTTTSSSIPVSVSGLASGVSQISSGTYHTCAVVSGGAKCWGSNVNYQLGDGTVTERHSPVNVSGLTSGVTKIASGEGHSCAIVNGGAKCWGNNLFGRLGDGTTVTRTTPVNVSGLTSGVSQISVSRANSCAIVNGGAKCWGLNGNGQVGDGTTTNRYSPVDVSGLTSGVSQISKSKYEHTCAVVNGGVKCWGDNSYGELGDGTTTERHTPVDVSGLSSGVSQISGGSHYTCAVVNGGAKCWGFNNFGQLGDGSTTDRHTPVNVSGLASGVSQISSGGYHTCAVVNGGAKCWGSGGSGHLGNGTMVSSFTPQNVMSLGSQLSQVAAGAGTTCVIVGGAAKCWGYNNFGQLGDGTTVAKSTPTDVIGLSSGVTHIAPSISGNHVCAVVNAAAKCWGYNSEGRLGDGSTTQRTSPANVVGLSSGVTHITTGHKHSCAVVSGAAKCWGWNSTLQLGDGSASDRTSPADVLTLSSNVTEIEAGYNHTCALVNGEAKCWGDNNSKQLGIGPAPLTTSNPTTVTGLTSGVSQISLGQYYTCAVVDGGAKCWGENGNGQLGDSSTTDRDAPVDVSGLTSGVTQVSAGFSHTCAIASGGAKCWGFTSTTGRLGDGVTTSATTTTPVDVVGLSSGVSQISVSFDHACVIVDGGAKCWGDTNNNQLGDNLSWGSGRSTPVSITGIMKSGVSDIAVGREFTCAIVNGAAKCWGLGSDGRLGNGLGTSSTTPVQVTGLTSGVTSISLGYRHACAVMNGAAKCWGDNGVGQAGDGSGPGAYKSTPVQVTGLTAGISQISVGDNHSCVVVNGGAKCWGRGANGQLGDSNNTLRAAPVNVTGLSAGVTQIKGGGEHTCAVVNGAAKCWGANDKGQLGNGTTGGTTNVPGQVTGLTSGVSDISAGILFTCAVVDGGAKCWGFNNGGQLGDNSTTDSNLPGDVIGLTSEVSQVSSGAWHSCAVVNGGAQCWGYNASGTLADGNTTDRLTPVTATEFGSGITEIATGRFHTCAISNGIAKCTGSNSQGQMGTSLTGISVNKSEPVELH